jgi:hypothetical protein
MAGRLHWWVGTALRSGTWTAAPVSGNLMPYIEWDPPIASLFLCRTTCSCAWSALIFTCWMQSRVKNCSSCALVGSSHGPRMGPGCCQVTGMAGCVCGTWPRHDRRSTRPSSFNARPGIMVHLAPSSMVIDPYSLTMASSLYRPSTTHHALQMTICLRRQCGGCGTMAGSGSSGEGWESGEYAGSHRHTDLTEASARCSVS